VKKNADNDVVDDRVARYKNKKSPNFALGNYEKTTKCLNSKAFYTWQEVSKNAKFGVLKILMVTLIYLSIVM